MPPTPHDRTVRPKAPLTSCGAAIVAMLIAAASSAPGRGEERGPEIVGCESLVALRLRGAGARSSMDAAKSATEQPGCRRIPRGDFGEVRQRAMVGGAPFECLALRGSDACAWVSP